MDEVDNKNKFLDEKTYYTKLNIAKNKIELQQNKQNRKYKDNENDLNDYEGD